MLLFYWVDETPVTVAIKHVEITEKTGIDGYGWFRDVCSTRLLNDGQIKLDGPGVIVQIDESCFSHKPKVNNEL